MKRMKIFQTAAMFMLIILLSNCGRLIDWTKRNFYQGDDVTLYTTNVKPYIRSVTIYDQLQTKAHFSIMWLSDPVRTAYAHLHTKRMALDEGRYKTFVRRQLEENHHYISFYILSTHEVKLGVPESHWSLFLRIGNRDFQPATVKEVDLPPEYQEFFGNDWNRFKVPYIVKFSLYDENEEPIISDETKSMSFFVRSAQKEHAFTFDLHADAHTERKKDIQKNRTRTSNRKRR